MPRVRTCSAVFLLTALSTFCQAGVSPPDWQKTQPDSTSVLSPADARRMIQEARRSYYSLRARGALGFHCQVLPDWDSFYRGLKVDAVGREQLLPILREARFQLVVGPSGASNISHQSQAAPVNEEVAERMRKALTGVEQMLTGFFQTWAPFVLTSPFPEVDDDYQFADLGDQYLLRYKEGSSHVATSMNHDFVVTEMKVVAPEFTGSVYPHVSPTQQGLLLVAYEATYKATGGQPQRVAAKIEYEEREGLQIPGNVNASVELPSGMATMSFSFTDCQVSHR